MAESYENENAVFVTSISTEADGKDQEVVRRVVQIVNDAYDRGERGM